MHANLNLRTFEYVVSLHLTGSLSGAVTQCRATPGTISGQISRLERDLGIRIFERRNFPAALTPVGAKLVPEMMKVLEQIGRVRVLAQEAEDVRSRGEPEPLNACG